MPNPETDDAETPLDRERALVDLLWSASAARAAAERDAVSGAARERSLNDRMHRSALDSLEASFGEQMSAIMPPIALTTCM